MLLLPLLFSSIVLIVSWHACCFDILSLASFALIKLAFISAELFSTLLVSDILSIKSELLSSFNSSSSASFKRFRFIYLLGKYSLILWHLVRFVFQTSPNAQLNPRTTTIWRFSDQRLVRFSAQTSPNASNLRSK